jgi:hypothetical protein
MSIRLLTCTLLLSMVAMTVAADDAHLPLVTDGRSDYVIILSPQASPSERWAAQELADHIR